MPHSPTATSPTATAASGVDIESAKHTYRFLRLLAVMALVMGSASAFTLTFVDPDLWGHVVYGQELLAEGELPRTATHTFTAEGYRWVNHENLAEIVFAAGFERGGVRGMLIAKCLLGMTILLMMLHAARRRGVRTLTAWALLLLIAMNLKAFFVMRPQLLSFACCGTMLLLIEHAFANWRRENEPGEPSAEAGGRGSWIQCQVQWPWLLAVPALMVVWVNSHGGFLAGYAILGALLAGRAFEAILVDGRRSIGAVAGMTAVGLVCLGGLFVNPYGAGLLEWLAESLGSPRPEITEWAPLRPSHPIFWPFVALAGVTIASLVFTDRRRDWTQVAILALVAWQAIEHLRHVAFFTLLAGFWTPPHLQAALARVRRRAAAGLPVTDIGPVFKWAAAGALAVACIVPAYGIAVRLTVLPVPRSTYPIDAFDFMSLNGVHGRMVVSFNWAQYALAAFPESTVSFDGRFRTCYPQEVVDMNFDFLLGENHGKRHRSPRSGPIDGRRVLDYGDPEIVIVDRKYVDAVGVMKKESDRPGAEWSLLYQDAVAQVWGRKQVFDDPASDRYVSAETRSITDDPRPLSIQWPAMPLQPPGPVAAADEAARGDGES